MGPDSASPLPTKCPAVKSLGHWMNGSIGPGARPRQPCWGRQGVAAEASQGKAGPPLTGRQEVEGRRMSRCGALRSKRRTGDLCSAPTTSQVRGGSPAAWAGAPGKAGCSRRSRWRRRRGRAGYGRCRTSPSRCAPRRRRTAPPPAPSASCASAASPHPRTGAAGIDHPRRGHTARRPRRRQSVSQPARRQLPRPFSQQRKPSRSAAHDGKRSPALGGEGKGRPRGLWPPAR